MRKGVFMEGVCLFAVPMTPQDRLDHLVQHFQNPPAKGMGNGLWLAILITAVVGAAAWLIGRRLWAKLQKQNHPWRLFFALCRRYRLTHTERWTLWTLARSRTPEMPARVFLDPDVFRPDQLPTLLTSKADLLENLRLRLFGQIDVLPGNHSGDQAKLVSAGLTSQEKPTESSSAVPAGFPTVRAPGLDLPPWNGAIRPTGALPHEGAAGLLDSQESGRIR